MLPLCFIYCVYLHALCPSLHRFVWFYLPCTQARRGCLWHRRRMWYSLQTTEPFSSESCLAFTVSEAQSSVRRQNSKFRNHILLASLKCATRDNQWIIEKSVFVGLGCNFLSETPGLHAKNIQETKYKSRKKNSVLKSYVNAWQIPSFTKKKSPRY